MRNFLLKMHRAIVDFLTKLWITENILIAKTKENGEYYDCIYCTILRNLVIGFLLGLFVGCMAWKS